MSDETMTKEMNKRDKENKNKIEELEKHILELRARFKELHRLSSQANVLMANIAAATYIEEESNGQVQQ